MTLNKGNVPVICVAWLGDVIGDAWGKGSCADRPYSLHTLLMSPTLSIAAYTGPAEGVDYWSGHNCDTYRANLSGHLLRP